MPEGSGGITNINSTLKNVATNLSQINTAFQSFAAAVASTLLRLSGAISTAGTVHSVGLALPPATFTVSGSPVTNTGTLTGSYIQQSPNVFFAGPGSGSATAVPSWRTFTTNDFNSGTGAGTTTTFWRGDLTWAVPPQTALNFTFITTVVITNGTIGNTTAFTGAFRSFQLIIKNIVPSATASFALQVHTSGGFAAANYSSTVFSSSGGAGGGLNPANGIPVGASNNVTNADPGLCASIIVSNLTAATGRKQWFGNGSWLSGTVPAVGIFGGFWNGSTIALDGFQLVPSAGTITSGSIDIYGIT